MKIIKYALKSKKYFIGVRWNQIYEWEEFFKSTELNELNYNKILLNEKQQAYYRKKELIGDIKDEGERDDIKIQDIEGLEVIKIEMEIDFKY